MINLEKKKILVLGFARSGYSTAKILKKLGYDVTLNAYDDLSNDEKAVELKELGIEVIDGEHPLELLENIDLIVAGRQAIDGDTAQVGPQIAEHLDLPQVSYVKEMKYNEASKSFEIKRATEDDISY